jgi:hypothetical protein
VQGHLGYGVPIGSHMQLEALPYLGFGRAYLRTNDFARDGSQNGDDAVYELGINGNFAYTFDNGLQLGANARYFFTEGGITDEQSGTRFSFQIRDFSMGVFLGVRL